MSAANLKNRAWLSRFRRQMLAWYRTNRRELPWRETRDPYKIWVSEVMLQQTRVAAVIGYYRKFLKRFPTVAHLAIASEADVLAQWSGLGYYRRARMLHLAAKTVHRDHSGAVPSSSNELRKLPGIGRYTANALASIAFGEAVAVVDGNVERVIGRVIGKAMSGEKLWDAATALLDPQKAGDFNQAMMELGATVCVPGVPLCPKCPIKNCCLSRGTKRQRTTLPEQRTRKCSSLLLARRSNSILLQMRCASESLMPGMWELPQTSRKPRGKPLVTVRHSITTTDWNVNVFPQPPMRTNGRTQWIRLDELSGVPLTGLTRKVLRNLKLLP